MLTGAAGSPLPAPTSSTATAVAPPATAATGGISAANLSAILAGIGRGAGAGVQVCRFCICYGTSDLTINRKWTTETKQREKSKIARQKQREKSKIK
jgi:hypothetical protein